MTDAYTELADVLEVSTGVARSELGGRSAETLRLELEQVRMRLRAIDTRLAEIAGALEQIETMVIAEASVVATTLTRAYRAPEGCRFANSTWR